MTPLIFTSVNCNFRPSTEAIPIGTESRGRSMPIIEEDIQNSPIISIDLLRPISRPIFYGSQTSENYNMKDFFS